MLSPFGSCTSITRGNILVDELPHVRPPVVSLNKFQSLCLSKVSCSWGVMKGFQDLYLKVIIVWYIDKILV
jgi:hypothetical protein